jgi:Uma2 family endonuclease
MEGRPESEERGVLVQHRVSGFSEQWVLEEDTVPEAAWHDQTLELLKAILVHWVRRSHRDAAIFRDLAVRVQRDRPSVGISPDIILVEPAPPGANELSSLRLWEPGNAVPSLVIEVVSPGHPSKDYVEVPDQCAALGVRELVVFDPLGVGPKSHGGPALLQLWRSGLGGFTRVAVGNGPFHSEVLGAHLVVTDEGRRLRFSVDPEGHELWLTAEETERTQKEAERRTAEAERRIAETERRTAEAERRAAEAERRTAEAERHEKERALARVAELEALLRGRG